MKMYDRARLVERFLDCVREVGTVKFILFGSVAGAETESTTFGKEFRMVEKKIEGLGISWCFLRMAMFLVRQCLPFTFTTTIILWKVRTKCLS
jgi:uncharacterized protein YbjT (DUF2867 family)